MLWFQDEDVVVVALKTIGRLATMRRSKTDKAEQHEIKTISLIQSEDLELREQNAIYREVGQI